MSVEFVEPDAAPTGGAPRVPAPVPPRSAVAGRVLGALALAAGVVTLVAVRLTLYAVVRTAAIVDFDGTTYRVARIPVDAFGGSAPVRLTTTPGLAMSDIDVTASLPTGVAYGPWWTGLGVALLLVGGCAVFRPRAVAPATVAAALGGVLLGSAGAAWLAAARASALLSQPQLAYRTEPGAGLWALVAAGALALLAGVAVAAVPAVHPRRRVRVPRNGAGTA